ncbi:MAG TPA: phosphatase PAP2 family protein [Bacillota bacterium]|nr:phosphatase PAP2 family protein [Bacillota bacterium]
MHCRWFIVLILIGMMLGLWGEPASAADLPGASLAGLVEEYWNDTCYILSAPARWEGRDWLGAGLVLSTALALYESDEDIQRHFRNHRNSTMDNVSDFAENFGDVTMVLPALALAYGYGKYSGNSELQTASLLSIESVVISSGFTVGLKMFTHRSRPYTGEGHDRWDGISGSFSDKKLSFPSAHSAAAFATATVFATVYKDRPWVPYVVYGLASMTALSRIYDDKHWASDVFVGSVIGWYSAKQVLARRPQSENNRITWMPTVVPDGVGVMFRYHF